MGRPITVRIPHALGLDEARRRIENGFSSLEQQLAGGSLGLVSLQRRWETNSLHLAGGALGQQISGRLDVLPDAVQIQIELPELLAALADRIKANLSTETRKLLEKK